MGWTLAEIEVDASRYKSAARRGRVAAAPGDTSQAVARFEEALDLWRGIPELPDGQRGRSEMTRWIEGHAALVQDRADALLATGHAAEIIGELEAAVSDAPLRERRWGRLMLALYRASRQTSTPRSPSSTNSMGGKLHCDVSTESNANNVSRSSPNRFSPSTSRQRFSTASAVERSTRSAWRPRGVSSMIRARASEG